MSEENNTQEAVTTEGEQTQTTEKTEEPLSQAKVQSLIDDAYTRAYAKANKAKTGSDTELQNANQQIEDLKKQVAAGNKKPTGNVIDPDEMAAINKAHQDREAELTRQLEDNNKTMQQDRKNRALIDSLSDKEVVNITDTMNLMQPFISFDDEGNMVVLNENGNPKHTADGGLMTVKDFASSFLEDRQYLVKGSQGGGGSQSAVFSEGGKINIETPEQYRALSREQKDAIKKQGIKMTVGNKVVSFKETKNPFIDAKKRGIARDNRR
jgi:hypothetical protein